MSALQLEKRDQLMTNASTKAQTIADLLEETQSAIFKIQAMTDGGYVQSCGDLFVNDTLWLGSLLNAAVYTDAQMDACAEYGVGLPSYTNGNGEKSALITVKAAKKKAIESLLRNAEFIKTL